MKTYIVNPNTVQEAVYKLGNRKSHDHLPGYFALLRLRLIDVDGTSLHEIEKFHEQYLRFPDAPLKSPYLKPFRYRGTGVNLLNKNIQGSYAPSSIRQGKPFSHLIEIAVGTTEAERGGVKYRLVDNHANIVLSEMLSGHKILAASLGFFLFRNHTLLLNNAEPMGIILALREFFRIQSEDAHGDEIFEILFEDDSQEYALDGLDEYGVSK